MASSSSSRSSTNTTSFEPAATFQVAGELRACGKTVTKPLASARLAYSVIDWWITDPSAQPCRATTSGTGTTPSWAGGTWRM